MFTYGSVPGFASHFHCSGGGPRSLRSFSGGFRGRALPRPLPTLSPSLTGHLASVDVKQHESGSVPFPPASLQRQVVLFADVAGVHVFITGESL